MRIATSLGPHAIEHQLTCIRNLQSKGFEVVLVQAKSEQNRPALHGVTYVDCTYAPPTIDELLRALPDNDYGGIINADVMLSATAAEIRAKMDATKLPLCAHRWECDEWYGPQSLFTAGFDFFFFHGSLKKHLGPSHFQLGRPAWDYWVPLKLLDAGQLILLTDPLAFHVRHDTRWDGESYTRHCQNLITKAGGRFHNTHQVQLHVRHGCRRESLRDVGRTAIFIRSFARDAAWLEYAMRSIKKFARGFAYTLVTVPLKDHSVFAPLAAKWGFRLHEGDEPSGKGMLHGEIRLCRADELCPDADNVLFTDSDCVFTEPVCPQDYFVDGKPVLMVESFEKLRKEQSPRMHWYEPVKACLGFDPPYETMCRHPAVHPTWLFPEFRAAVERHVGRPFDEYVLAQRNEYPQTFAEFCSLGAFAVEYYASRYHLADRDTFTYDALSMNGDWIKRDKLKQNWSHGGITPQIEEELERLLA